MLESIFDKFAGQPCNNISIENYRELPLSKQNCKTDFDDRKILKQLKLLTYIITDTAALKELKKLDRYER